MPFPKSGNAASKRCEWPQDKPIRQNTSKIAGRVSAIEDFLASEIRPSEF
jgi:hypothetical protein